MAKIYIEDFYDDDDDFSYQKPQKIKRPVGSAPKQKQYVKQQKQTFRKERQAKQKEQDRVSSIQEEE